MEGDSSAPKIMSISKFCIYSEATARTWR